MALPDLTISDSVVRNEGQYLKAKLTYPALFTADDVLWPHLLLEFTFSDVRLPIEKLSINTIIEEIIKIPEIFSPLPVDCISPEEMAIEKWVGLTRRVAAIDRKYHDDDPALVRHMYDLNAINQADKINDSFFNLAKSIINYDAKQFKKQHPEYFNNSAAEIRRSLEILKSKKLWEERYQRFVDSMVYDKAVMTSYDSAMVILEDISETILNFS